MRLGGRIKSAFLTSTILGSVVGMPRPALAQLEQGSQAASPSSQPADAAVPNADAGPPHNAAPVQPAPSITDHNVNDQGDIIVTGRRVTERLKDVPASVSVLSERTIVAAGLRNTDDFIQLTPGITMVTGNTEVGDTQVNVRGINGARDSEPSVGLVVDGIVKTNTAALNQLQGDVIQVEFFKGPQGAYYGRNASAGAIVMTTRRPGPVLEGRTRMSFAQDNTIDAFASVDGPVTNDIGFVLSADYRKTDGFQRNTGPIAASQGATVDSLKSWNFAGRVVANITPDTELDLKGRVGGVNANSVIYNAAFALPAFAQAFGNPDFDEDVNDHHFQFITNLIPLNKQRSSEASARITQDFGGAKLIAYAAYSNIKQSLSGDGTSGAFGFFFAEPGCRQTTAALFAQGYQFPSPTFLGPTPEASLYPPYSPTTCDGTLFQERDQRDLSFEARLASDTSGPLRWQFGLYHLNIHRLVGNNLGIDEGFGVIRELFTTDPRNPTEQLVADRYRTNVNAVFGSVTYAVSPQLTLDAALRFDREDRKVIPIVPTDAVTRYVDYDGPPFTGGVPLNPGLFLGPVDPQSARYQQLQPKISALYHVSDDFTLFANWGIGFKAGGFNPSGSAATIDLNFNQTIGANLDISDRYRKETSSAFEGGFRADLLDKRLTFDGAVYYTRAKDLQYFEFFVGSFGLLRVVSNIDRVEIKGAELSANFRVTNRWSIFGSGNIIGSKIKKNSVRPDTVGNKSPYTPDYTMNLGTQLSTPVSARASLVGRLDYRLVGPTWFSTVQDQTRPTIFGVPGDYSKSRRDAYGLVNARLGIEYESVRITAFADNVFDKHYLEDVVMAPEFGGSFISPSTERRLGVEAGFSF